MYLIPQKLISPSEKMSASLKFVTFLMKNENIGSLTGIFILSNDTKFTSGKLISSNFVDAYRAVQFDSCLLSFINMSNFQFEVKSTQMPAKMKRKTTGARNKSKSPLSKQFFFSIEIMTS